ncbi:MAG: hypothetical protein DRP82_07465, partial [Planctomycetota bacterium]
MRYKVLLFSVYAALAVVVCGCEPGFFAAVYYLYSDYSSRPKPLRIRTKSLPDATAGENYSAYLKAEGGKKPYSWRLVGGTTPRGISVETDGLVHGVPLDVGSFSLQVEVKDAEGRSRTATVSLCVQPPSQPLQIVTTSLPEGAVGVAYAFSLSASGGVTPYIWSDVNNTLQTYGLTLDPTTGEITGTPTQATPAGGVTVTIEVTDANSKTARKDLTLVIYPELLITATTLPDGYEGQTGYSAALTATGGTGNYTWSLTRGSLPSNLTWNATTATISGDIATATAGDYQLDFQVTDGMQTATATLTLTVRAPLQITTTSLPDAYEGLSYSCTLQAAGGNPNNYTWSISQQPSWLSIDAATGQLSGRPPANSAGTYAFTVEVTDGQQTASQQFDLVVNTGGVGGGTLKADFEANTTLGNPPLTVNFTDRSAGNPTTWQWDFDNDGTPDSTDQNPTYTYSNPGWYTVKLTVSDGANSDTCVKEMYILVANNIWYVNGKGGDDANGGTSWSDAFATIGKALSVAGDYNLVLVADATYNEIDLNFSGKKVYLKGVAHNNAGQQPVIDIGKSGRAFYFSSGETEDSVIDGIEMKGGNNDNGAAIYIASNSSPTIIDCTFSNNRASYYGGAIYCESGDPRIVRCRFSGNSAGWDGGAIYCFSSRLTVSDCTFTGNSAKGSGGAICCTDRGPTVTRCAFNDNSASDDGGAIACYSSVPTVTNCAFSGNSAGDDGGAVCCDDSGSPSIINCLFSGNSATKDGGAVAANSSSSPTLINCTFHRNSANQYGGAVQCDSNSNATLNNCILWGDSAASDGKEIYINDSGSSCTLNYCCADSAGYGGQTGNITENNCIHQDPQLADP